MRPRRAVRPDAFAVTGVVLGLVASAGLMWSLDTTAAPTPAVTRHVTTSPAAPVDTDTTIDESIVVGADVIDEDSPLWNCLTMGNRRCGPDYVPLGEDVADAMAEGEDFGEPPTPWEDCLIEVADTTTIVCPNGSVFTS